MKIEKLTKEQEKFLIEYRNTILEYGRSTLPSDRKTAEKSISFFYNKIKKQKPMFFWFDSPYIGIISIEILKDLLKNTKFQALLNEKINLESNLRSNLRSNLWLNLESNLRSNLESNLRSNLESNLESNLWLNLESNLRSNLRSNLWLNLESNLRSNLESNLRSNLRSNLESNLESNLWSNLWLNLESNLRSNLRSNLDNILWGQHELYWIAFYDFCNLIGIKYKKEDKEVLDGWLNIGKSTGWWIPFENICFCFERPKILNLNKKEQLHCLTGPAMAFRDGYSLYYLNGKQIPNEVIGDGKNCEIKIKTWAAFEKS